MQQDHAKPQQRSRLVPTILGRLAIAGVLGVTLLGTLVWNGAIAIPNRLNPFTPLRIADDVNWLTRVKIARLERDNAQCSAVLAETPIAYRSISDREASEGCGLSNAVEVTGTALKLSRSFTATCPLVVSWALLERHVIRPAARQHLEQDVGRIVHAGTYACRNINHRADGRRSEHATANAIDISGFILADGQQITLQRDWVGGDPRRKAFLRAVRDGACRFFDVVLSPDYNQAHWDHFHFDMGHFRACR